MNDNREKNLNEPEELSGSENTAEEAEQLETVSPEQLENEVPAEEAAPEEGPSEEEPTEEAAPEEELPPQGGLPAEPETPSPKKAISAGALNKFKKGGMASILTAVFLAIVIVINILAAALTERYPSLNIDLTAQKLNTLSEQALSVARDVKEETTLYLIGTEDGYRKDIIHSTPYNLKYSQVSTLADKLHEANPLIKVKFVDPDTNPTFLNEYASESITTGKVLVKTEKRYKLLAVSDMFSLAQNSMGAYDNFSKVDSALAAAIEAVNLDKIPVLTIATGHGELLSDNYLSAFQAMMEDQNFAVEMVDFMTEEIPEATQVLMIPTPSNDYTGEEIQKLRDFLNNETRDDDLNLLVSCYPMQGDLPKLEAFLEEWGVKVEDGMIAETDASRVAVGNAMYILVDPTGSALAGNSYNRLVAPECNPLSLTFDENDGISTQVLWSTAASAYVVTDGAATPETGKWAAATLSTRTVQALNGPASRRVMVFGSSYTFMDTFLNTSAFGNRAYLSDLMAYAAGTDGSAVNVAVNEVQTNVMDVSVSQQTATLLGLGVFTIGLPLLILIFGLTVFLKRRHL